MSKKYLPKPLYLGSLGLAIQTIGCEAHAAQAQSQPDRNFRSALPSADEINKKIERSYPQDLLGDDKTANPAQSPSPAPSVAPTTVPSGSTAITAANYTFVLSTPALIAVGVVVGGLALFPIFHLLLNSKKAAEIGKNKMWSKLADRFQKPQVLESDAFLHQRNFEKLSQLANQAENIHADKFGNTEFMTFFKIKSYIARSVGEYTNLDEIIELLKISIDTQNSFATIDSTESRHCSSSQQELYKFVNLLYEQNLDHETFRERVELKLQEVLPKLKTDEGREVLQTYAKEVAKVARHRLAVKLLQSFKKYNLADYSILRSVANTINLLDGEDLLNLDGLMLLVMVKYEVFEKLGPIVGVAEEYNRPETYSKMLQYIGLKSRHEGSFEKFQEFLLTLKQWEIHYRTIGNVREKYDIKDYRLPKDFTAEVPGAALYQKYKDSFHLIASAAPTIPLQPIDVVTAPIPEPVVAATPIPVVASVPELIVAADTADSVPVESAEPSLPTLTGIR
jgi:hypothetical protein